MASRLCSLFAAASVMVAGFAPQSPAQAQSQGWQNFRDVCDNAALSLRLVPRSADGVPFAKLVLKSSGSGPDLLIYLTGPGEPVVAKAWFENLPRDSGVTVTIDGKKVKQSKESIKETEDGYYLHWGPADPAAWAKALGTGKTLVLTTFDEEGEGERFVFPLDAVERASNALSAAGWVCPKG